VEYLNILEQVVRDAADAQRELAATPKLGLAALKV
jgi:hypothetical protein